MKTIVSLLICTCFFFSCNEKKSANETERSGSVDQTTTNETKDSKRSILWEVKTATDKFLRVEENKQSASLSHLKIITEGYANTKDVFEIREADPLSRIFALDLNKDGFDEFYLITRAAGSGGYERIIGFASNNDLSITPVYVPKMTEKDLSAKGDYYGYMGHDSIYVEKEQLYRKFPVYLEGDANCCPTGGNTTVSYQLKPGEAGWILTVNK